MQTFTLLMFIHFTITVTDVMYESLYTDVMRQIKKKSCRILVTFNITVTDVRYESFEYFNFLWFDRSVYTVHIMFIDLNRKVLY